MSSYGRCFAAVVAQSVVRVRGLLAFSQGSCGFGLFLLNNRHLRVKTAFCVDLLSLFILCKYILVFNCREGRKDEAKALVCLFKHG